MKKTFRQFRSFIRKNAIKIAVIVVLPLLLEGLLNLPYFNIARIYFSALPYLIEWIVFLILFKPQKQTFIIIAGLVWVVGFVGTYAFKSNLLDVAAQVVFLLLVSYVVFSYNEIKKWG